jgi:ATP-binding cassette subfamily B protein
MASPGILREQPNRLATMIWALRRTWRISKALLALVLLSGLLRSLVPLGLALAGRELINAVSAGDRERGMIWLGASMVLALLMALALALFKFSSQRLRDKLDLEIVSDLMQLVSSLEFAMLENKEFQDVLHQVRQNAGLHFSLFIDHSMRMASNCLICLGFVAILTAIAPLFCLWAAPIAGIYLFFQLHLARRGFEEVRDNMSKWRWTHYYINRISEPEPAAEIRFLSMAAEFLKRYRKLMREITGRRLSILKLQLSGEVVFSLVMLAVVYYFLRHMIQYALSGQLTMGDLVLFIAAATQVRMLIQSGMTSAAEIKKSLFHIFCLANLYQYDLRTAADGNQSPPNPTGRIDFNGVHFCYPGGSKPVLHGVSLRIEPGETLALVGENGAGKTTLVKLLGRLYEPDQGSIQVDGLELNKWSLDQLHRRFSFALQNFSRFEASAAENIAFGNWPHLQDNPDAVETTARQAGIHEMVSSLPKGYQTRLGWLFGEHTLSGGQWQQIALARAFSRPDSILVLDEPTANLDAMTEYRIFRRFSKMAVGRTALIISHRFATVSMADRIAVMAEGRIVEIGTHQELMSLGGAYAAMYNLQAANFPQGQAK